MLFAGQKKLLPIDKSAFPTVRYRLNEFKIIITRLNCNGKWKILNNIEIKQINPTFIWYIISSLDNLLRY